MDIEQHMKHFLINILNTGLSEDYVFHNNAHTIYVHDIALKIAATENCTVAEIRLLKAAALWHDAGYTKTYANHEQESCKMAKQHLPQFDYSKEEIHSICGMIMATKIPQLPKNLLEKIIADADLEYLGTLNARHLADKLFYELQFLNPSLTKKQWNQTQISFLEQHRYFTDYCKNNSEPVKQAYLAQLKREAVS